MVFIGILIILLILALISANNIAEWANGKISKAKEKKRTTEERRQKRVAHFEHTQQEMRKLFGKRHSSVNEAVDELIEECKDKKKEQIAPSVDEEKKTVEKHIKEDLRGPILGNVYYDPRKNNLVSSQWVGEHDIYDYDDIEDEWDSRYVKLNGLTYDNYPKWKKGRKIY